MKTKVLDRKRPAEITEKSMVKTIGLTKDDKQAGIQIPIIFVSTMLTVVTAAGFIAGAPIDMIGSTLAILAPTLLTVGGIVGTGSILESKRGNLITTLVGESGTITHAVSEAIKASRKERILVNSFHIKESIDVEVTSWQDPSSAVSETESTHTIKQYASKKGGKYQVEQEVVPNAETIWDLSANALVEVYGINESRKRQIFTLNQPK